MRLLRIGGALHEGNSLDYYPSQFFKLELLRQRLPWHVQLISSCEGPIRHDYRRNGPRDEVRGRRLDRQRCEEECRECGGEDPVQQHALPALGAAEVHADGIGRADDEVIK
jgi:hypothetical protein